MFRVAIWLAGRGCLSPSLRCSEEPPNRANRKWSWSRIEMDGELHGRLGTADPRRLVTGVDHKTGIDVVGVYDYGRIMNLRWPRLLFICTPSSF